MKPIELTAYHANSVAIPYPSNWGSLPALWMSTLCGGMQLGPTYAALPHLLAPSPKSPTAVAKGTRAQKGSGDEEREQQGEAEKLLREDGLKETDEEQRGNIEQDQGHCRNKEMNSNGDGQKNDDIQCNEELPKKEEMPIKEELQKKEMPHWQKSF